MSTQSPTLSKRGWFDALDEYFPKISLPTGRPATPPPATTTTANHVGTTTLNTTHTGSNAPIPQTQPIAINTPIPQISSAQGSPPKSEIIIINLEQIITKIDTLANKRDEALKELAQLSVWREKTMLLLSDANSVYYAKPTNATKQDLAKRYQALLVAKQTMQSRIETLSKELLAGSNEAAQLALPLSKFGSPEVLAALERFQAVEAPGEPRVLLDKYTKKLARLQGIMSSIIARLTDLNSKFQAQLTKVSGYKSSWGQPSMDDNEVSSSTNQLDSNFVTVLEQKEIARVVQGALITISYPGDTNNVALAKKWVGRLNKAFAEIKIDALDSTTPVAAQFKARYAELRKEIDYLQTNGIDQYAAKSGGLFDWAWRRRSPSPTKEDRNDSKSGLIENGSAHVANSAATSSNASPTPVNPEITAGNRVSVTTKA